MVLKSIVKRSKRNKKGDASSLIIGLVVIVFVIGIIGLMAGKFIPSLMSIMKADPTISANNNSIAVIEMVETKTIPWLDYFFLFSFVATIIGIIISSIYIDSHPAVMIIFIIMLVLGILFAGIFANAYVQVGETDTMLSTYNQFTATKAIFDHLPLILFITGLIVITVLYGKSRNSMSSGGGPI